MKEIEICMGSSCYSRGNRKNLEVIQEFLKTRGLDARVYLRGSLCSGNCRRGPNLTIDGRPYSEVTPSLLTRILEDLWIC